MRLLAESEIFPEYIRFNLSGEFVYDEVLQFVETTRTVAEDANRSRILVDSRELKGHITESHKYFIGTRIAEVFGSAAKSVLIMREGTVTKLGELAAVNRGARFLVTDSEDEAFDWLLS